MFSVDKFRDIGLKLTPQRLAILHYLEGNKTHPSAEDIYQAVLKKFPTISFATIYTTLAALTKRGRLFEITSDPAKKRYDPDTRAHSHFLCVSCKRVFDIPAEFTLSLPEKIKQKFVIIKSCLDFQGFCPTCKKGKQRN